MTLSTDFQQLLDEGHIKSIRLNGDYSFDKPFDCGVDDLNDFLLTDSKAHLRHLNFVTTIIESDEHLIAYYSLSNDVLRVDSVEDLRYDTMACKIHPDYADFFYTQQTYPAVKLGRLAVDVRFQRQNVGQFIMDAIKISFTNENKTGCQFITVDAVNTPDVLRFYEREGFSPLTMRDVRDPSRQMYRCLLDYIEI